MKRRANLLGAWPRETRGHRAVAGYASLPCSLRSHHARNLSRQLRDIPGPCTAHHEVVQSICARSYHEMQPEARATYICGGKSAFILSRVARLHAGAEGYSADYHRTAQRPWSEKSKNFKTGFDKLNLTSGLLVSLSLSKADKPKTSTHENPD